MKRDMNADLYTLIDEICEVYDCRECPYTEEIFGTYGEGSIDACQALEKIWGIACKNF